MDRSQPEQPEANSGTGKEAVPDRGRKRRAPLFEGERDDQLMRKLAVSNPKVTCGSCRQFDQHTWCRHWNFHTTADSPICAFYKARR